MYLNLGSRGTVDPGGARAYDDRVVVIHHRLNLQLPVGLLPA